MRRAKVGLPWVVLLAVLLSGRADAQDMTMGGLAGVVADPEGTGLQGAVVKAVHIATGVRYEAQAGAGGRYSLFAVRVGSYTVTASMNGFQSLESGTVIVTLGEVKVVDFALPTGRFAQSVIVSGSQSELRDRPAGAAVTLDPHAIEVLPTIARSLTDLVRSVPLFNSMGTTGGAGPSVASVAGSSYRYNNFQIDGAQNNDLFGIGTSAGMPGGTAESEPVSLEAIGQLQLVVSAYDARQGGFAGGGINAITKSGSNAFHGAGFLYGRNQDWVGALNAAYVQPGGSARVSTFKDVQGGGSLGGPIRANRAFFFGVADLARKQRPTGFSVSSTGQLFGYESAVDRFLNGLQTRYGHSVGANAKEEFVKATNSTKAFARTDVNLGRHQLAIRHNFNQALSDGGTTSLTSFRLADAYYRYSSRANSFVAQLNSALRFGWNEFRFAYTRVHDFRAPVPGFDLFPQVTVTIAPGISVVAGTERSSARNAISQDIIEFNDAYTLALGSHTVTLGTHNEFLNLRNLFIRDNFGAYGFSSLDTFEAGFAQQFDRSFSATADPLQATAFRVRQWGVYASDLWRPTSSLALTLGARVETPRLSPTPSANPAAPSFGYRTDVVPRPVQWSPRAGISWSPWAGRRGTLRGGVGIFTGRPPYVWLGNQYGNTGVDFARIGASFATANRIPFVSDPSNQPTTVTGAAASSYTNEIDLIDPEFEYPSVLRGTVSWDRGLLWGFHGTAELSWSATIHDIAYRNVNIQQSSTVSGVGGRPYFAKVVPALGDVILLGDSGKGHAWNVGYQVHKPFSNRLWVSASYAFGKAYSSNDGTSDIASSNWGNVYISGSPNAPSVARSDYDPGHRMTVAASYRLPIAGRLSSEISVFYSGQSGRPFSLTYSRDVNGDGRATNDLLFIPSSATELTFTGGGYADFRAFINAEPCLANFAGRSMPRNGCRGPWINTLDGRFLVRVPVGRTKFDLTLDAANMLNLLNTRWGIFQYNSYGQLAVIQPVPTTVTAKAPLTGYDISALAASTFTRYLRDDLRSRWQLKLGGRVSF
jgi:hypothetical protein